MLRLRERLEQLRRAAANASRREILQLGGAAELDDEGIEVLLRDQ